MSYRVLARKYRPQTFEDIIGQAHIATTLANALKSQKVAHAYLFSGPRGVGKTTTARILAKALNCEKGPTPIPCNQCDSCQRIAQGQELVDVLEIDAASNRGIEEIRELRENVRYAPARSRYKVYIVDEAHQITHDAFNAFLKTLEEPPEHAVFILATTEHQKIPATILSRCQLFRFKRVSIDDTVAQLERILTQEKVKADKAALIRLARAAGGSVRDALSLLDQALAYAPDALTQDQVEMLLGFLPQEFLQNFAGALLSQQPGPVLQVIKRLMDEGWELQQFVRDFRDYLRETLIEQIGAGSPPQNLTVAGQAASLPLFLQMIKSMGQCLDEMRWNDNPRVVLELYSLRLIQPFVDAGALLQRLEILEKRLAATPSITTEKSSVTAPPHSERSSANVPVASAKAGVAAEKEVPPIRHESPQKESKTGVSVDNTAAWAQLLKELWKKPAVASHMERAHLKSATNTEWVIACPNSFAMETAQRSQAFIQEILAKIVGHPMGIQWVVELRASDASEDMVIVRREKESTAKPSSQTEAPPPPPAGDIQDANVQKVLQTFKGRIRSEEQ